TVGRTGLISSGTYTSANGDTQCKEIRLPRSRFAAPAWCREEAKKGHKSSQRSRTWPAGGLHDSEEIIEKAYSRALGAVCLLGTTSAELLRVKRHKFPDAHRRPAGHPLDAVRPPVIATRPVQLAHRQKMPGQMLRHTLP